MKHHMTILLQHKQTLKSICPTGGLRSKHDQARIFARLGSGAVLTPAPTPIPIMSEGVR
jgi:hypothetical protein